MKSLSDYMEECEQRECQVQEVKEGVVRCILYDKPCLFPHNQNECNEKLMQDYKLYRKV